MTPEETDARNKAYKASIIKKNPANYFEFNIAWLAARAYYLGIVKDDGEEDEEAA